jgi:hypothetical protein
MQTQRAASWPEHPIRGAPDGGGAAVEDVSVDHGRGDVAVAEQLLHGPDVMAVLEQMRCE